MSNNTPHDDLLCRVLSGPLTDELSREFDSWLCEDPKNPALFAQFLILENMIVAVRKETSAKSILSLLLEMEEKAEPFSITQIPDRPLREKLAVFIRDRHVKLFAIAAIVVIAVSGTLWALSAIVAGTDQTTTPHVAGHNAQPDEMPKHVVRAVATLTATHNATWAEGALAPGDTLRPGRRLTLTAGFAEITTSRGAVAILEAPATIELTDNDNAIRLHSGKLVAICRTVPSKGFIVRTPHMDITDLSTEFGVHVDTTRVEASVFVGEVQVKTTDGSVQRVTHSQTARLIVDHDGHSLAIEDRAAEGFTRRTPRPALVTAVKLSIEGFEARVLPQGVYEDATLFTDRSHQINGIDEKGIPGFLLGGDLIQMPADARPDLHPRIGKDLTVQLELSALADIYVLLERGTKREPWLVQDYVLLDERVGNDHHTQADGQSPGIGPGISIDRHFEIWKRKAPASGQITAAGSIDATMYAIVVTPATEPARAN